MKPWDEQPLWWKCWIGPHSRYYLRAGKIINHLGCNACAFYDAAKTLPDYNVTHYEKAVRDLCLFEKREKGEYELTSKARKILRIVIGPAPDDPGYVRWWRARLVSVEIMRKLGQVVNWADSPPVPLPDETSNMSPEETSKSPKKPRTRRRKSG